MSLKHALIVVPMLLLSACGGEKQTVIPTSDAGSVVYSFPADGQVNVSPKADLVLRFSDAITDDAAASKIRLVADGDATPIDVSATSVDGGKSLVLSPSSDLAVGTDYTVTFTSPLIAAGGRAISTPNATGPEGIQFATRAGRQGLAHRSSLGDAFEVVDSVPDGKQFAYMDFSTLQLRTSHPIHPDSALYGSTVSLRDGNGNLVPATLIVKDNLLTVDPCTTEDPARCGSPDDQLDPSQTYTLSLDGITDLKGNTLSYETQFKPQETGPTVVLYQKIVDANNQQRSILDNQLVNGVVLNSVLQGTTANSQQTGDLYAELGYAPSFPADTPVPLRIPRGTVLQSSSLDVRINGDVPIVNSETGNPQQTGTIKVTMISDAIGYLYPNPYSDAPDAPRHVRLYMDVAMNTEQAQPNAALSQDLMRVELTGIAFVRHDLLTIDAIGMVEPSLLGQELTDSTIAFRLTADTSAQDSAPERPMDTTGPSLVSWTPGPDDAAPGNRDQMQRPGDPIVLNFDEPLKRDSIAGAFTLDADGVAVPADQLKTRLDGTTVAINPAGGLKHGVDYTLNIHSTLTDLAGNGTASQSLSFALPALSDGSEAAPASPLALTTYPGYPCVTTGLDLANDHQGICVDASPSGASGDMLPITTMPADQPITVVFSQSMQLDSIRLDDTLKVEKMNADGSIAGPVTGRLEKNQQRIRFFPDDPWQPGTYYRYSLSSATAKNDCANAICSAQGYPLQTDLLVDPTDVGGPDLTIYFKGAPSEKAVFTPLRNLPIRDVNSNYVVDCDSPGGTDCLEPFDHVSDGAGGFLPSANAAKLLVDGGKADAGLISLDARVGCSPTGSDCPDNKFIYQTYGLNTKIVGPVNDPDTGEQIGVRVLLYPTMLATTSASVYLSLVGEQPTGPQILRMRYAKDDPNCTSNCSRSGLIPGIIVEGDDGKPVFRTQAELMLDAPGLTPPAGGTHDLYSKPFTLQLEGPIVFFDDGRMQIEQRNTNQPAINVHVNALGLAITIPLIIPTQGVYLNFLSNPIKELPEAG